MLRKTLFALLLLVSTLGLGGCKVRVHYPAEFPSETIISQEKVYWFWGLMGESEYEVYDLCPKGRVYEVNISSTTKQSTYTALSLGIYSPRTLTIVCSIRGEET